MKVKCSHCKKSFDYENYYGLCPKCGTYNKKMVDSTADSTYSINFDGGKSSYQPEKEHRRMHEFYGEKNVHAGENRKSYLWIVIALILLMGIGTSSWILFQTQKLKTAEENRATTKDVPVVVSEMDLGIDTGEMVSTIWNAYEFEDKKNQLPEGTKLIALRCSFETTDDVNEDTYRRSSVVPYVYDGVHYRGYTYDDIPMEFAEDAGIADYVFTKYDFYDYYELDGVLLYLVDADAKTITVSIEDRDDGDLKKLYEVTVECEKMPENLFPEEYYEEYDTPEDEGVVNLYAR